jgi:hypothetical protein
LTEGNSPKGEKILKISENLAISKISVIPVFLEIAMKLTNL